jgi:hypothetical protein
MTGSANKINNARSLKTVPSSSGTRPLGAGTRDRQAWAWLPCSIVSQCSSETEVLR